MLAIIAAVVKQILDPPTLSLKGLGTGLTCHNNWENSSGRWGKIRSQNLALSSKRGGGPSSHLVSVSFFAQWSQSQLICTAHRNVYMLDESVCGSQHLNTKYTQIPFRDSQFTGENEKFFH